MKPSGIPDRVEPFGMPEGFSCLDPGFLFLSSPIRAGFFGETGNEATSLHEEKRHDREGSPRLPILWRRKLCEMIDTW